MPKFKGSCGCYNREDARTIGLVPAIVWNDILDRAEHFDMNPMWYDQCDAGERLGIPRQTINRAVKSLEDCGRIKTKLGYRPGTTTTTTWINIISEETQTGDILDAQNEHPKDAQNEHPIYKETNNDTNNTMSAPRMKPSALRQELARIFKSSDPSKTRSTQSVAQLQERIDDDQLILKAARKMKAQSPIEINGRMWKPDYFWFVNPDKTDTVAKRIIEAVKEDLIEEEIPEGLREQYDVAITLGEAQDYNECRENWGKILPKIKFTDEYRRLTDGR